MTIIGILKNALIIPHKIFRTSRRNRAISLVEKQLIDLAIVSHRLPNLDGLEILKALKSKFPRLPVVFVAEAPADDLIIAAFRYGASDFFKKPIGQDDLARTIGRLIEARISLKTWFKRLAMLAASWLKTFAKKEVSHGSFGSIAKDTPAMSLPETPINAGSEQAPLNSPIQEQQADDSVPRLQARYFGYFNVTLYGHVIDKWPSRKAKMIFAYLAFNHKRRVNRDRLLDKFWPDADPDSARNCLNVALTSIRRLLSQIDPVTDYILFKDECYFLSPEIALELDVETFLHHWKLAQSREREKKHEAALAEYERAAALYAGDFMEEEAYDNWPTSERENLQEIYLVILDRLSKHYSKNGKPETAIRLCEKILAKDDCREEVHRRLMRCYCRLGQRDKALRQFTKCKKILRDELEVAPTSATINLYAQVKQNNGLHEKKKKVFREF